MKRKYFKFVSAVHLFLVRDNKILLSRRFNTGYEDGKYGVPAGHIDGGEKATDAMTREAFEETGLIIDPCYLKTVHVMHRKSTEERIDFFFEINRWSGEPKNMETDKCDELKWFLIDGLPANLIPYVKAAIECYKKGVYFSEFGWR